MFAKIFPPTVSTAPSYKPLSKGLASLSKSPDFIIFFAPNDFKYSSFGFVVAAVTLHQSLLKIMTAILPTPPEAPVTITSLTFSPNNKTSLVCFVVKAH